MRYVLHIERQGRPCVTERGLTLSQARRKAMDYYSGIAELIGGVSVTVSEDRGEEPPVPWWIESLRRRDHDTESA